MSSMFNPPHPGLTLRDDILPALDLQVGEAAAQLGVDRTTLSKVVNGRAAISPSMALRIERWLGRDHGGAAEVWLAQQAAYDLWQARAARQGNQGARRRSVTQASAPLTHQRANTCVLSIPNRALHPRFESCCAHGLLSKFYAAPPGVNIGRLQGLFVRFINRPNTRNFYLRLCLPWP